MKAHGRCRVLLSAQVYHKVGLRIVGRGAGSSQAATYRSHYFVSVPRRLTLIVAGGQLNLPPTDAATSSSVAPSQ